MVEWAYRKEREVPPMTEPYVNPAELPVKRRENIALGVLGALLFSAASS